MRLALPGGKNNQSLTRTVNHGLAVAAPISQSAGQHAPSVLVYERIKDASKQGLSNHADID